jgi:hypothetical protein
MLRPSNQLGRDSGATCWPRTIGPAQREHTIGGNLLGGFVCLRRTSRRAELFGVGSDMVALDDAEQRADRSEENDDRGELRRGKQVLFPARERTQACFYLDTEFTRTGGSLTLAGSCLRFYEPSLTPRRAAACRTMAHEKRWIRVGSGQALTRRHSPAVTEQS